ncbi:high nitrogen upregulated cytochrome P450 monooxygenase 2 [Athelia psychrophila]|uniref:High nitrogen upregulated cytochrome P450 monooxygenase 2 n=1 Tax=Athelia psychrophila TaxID=1759441 RepID=A0A166MJQ6_9AGAM|nr:high nitrogen upregulated cytochrome P450 monooxygenase 2 [Fibularhizoctonia sp. CBS 109695]
MHSCPLSYQDAVLVTVGSGLACHLLVFKRYEPTGPSTHLGLLVAVPAILTWLFIPHCLNTLFAFVSSFVIYVASLVASVVIYRLGPFHPLAKYPGPMTGKLSKLWMSYVATTGRQHIYYNSLHHKYGDIVRIGPNELSVRDAAAVVPMMGSQGLPKGPLWLGRDPQRKGDSLIMLSGPEHTRRRRPWNRAFNSEALKGYEEIIEKRANQLIQTLGKQGGSINLAMWISYFTFDFMSDMAFGGGSEMLRDGDKDGIWRALDGLTRLTVAMGHSPWVARYYKYIPVGAENTRFREFAVNRAQMRIKQGSMTKDVFHHFLNEEGTDHHPSSIVEIISDSSLVIVAGSDTTSTVLSSLFWFIMCNPTIYRRLQDEIDSVFPPGENALDPSKHVHMNYLNAVINETLRLLPPVLSGSQRRVERGSGAATFGFNVIPEGTAVFSHFYSLHRDPRSFSPLPEVFWPDRWLPEGERTSPFSPAHKGPVNVILDRTAFTPFSFGPSNCVGKNLAIQEIRMVVCLMLQSFDMRFAEGYDAQRWERDIEDRLISHAGGLPVVLATRKV